MTVYGSTYIDKILKIYETEFNPTNKKQEKTALKNPKYEDEVVLSVEGKRKQLFEEMVLEVLGQLSTNVFENETK